ncbi:phage tail assembly chaperone [Rhizobiales bacterium]|nr:phage tail assembly chaperone [Hongsoonwoonella zoysiae]
MLSLCLGKLGWRPGDFWAATPREIANLFSVPDERLPISRGVLNGLMERYPDGR